MKMPVVGFVLMAVIVHAISAAEASLCSQLSAASEANGGGLHHVWYSDANVSSCSTSTAVTLINSSFFACLDAAHTSRNCTARSICVGRFVREVNVASLSATEVMQGGCSWLRALKVVVMSLMWRSPAALLNSTLHVGCLTEYCVVSDAATTSPLFAKYATMTCVDDYSNSNATDPATIAACHLDLNVTAVTPSPTLRDIEYTKTATAAAVTSRSSTRTRVYPGADLSATETLREAAEVEHTSTLTVGTKGLPTDAPELDWDTLIERVDRETVSLRAVFASVIRDDPPISPLPAECPADFDKLRDVDEATAFLESNFPSRPPSTAELVSNVAIEFSVNASNAVLLDTWVTRDDPPPPDPDAATLALGSVRKELLLLDTLDAYKTLQPRCWTPLSTLAPPSTVPAPPATNATTKAPPTGTPKPSTTAAPSTLAPNRTNFTSPTTRTPAATTTTRVPTPEPTETFLPTLPPNATFPPLVDQLKFIVTLRNNPAQPFDRLNFLVALASVLNTTIETIEVSVIQSNSSSTGDIVVDVRYLGPTGPELQEKMRSLPAKDLDELGIVKMAPEPANPKAEDESELRRSDQLVWIGGVCAVAIAVVALVLYNNHAAKKRQARRAGQFQSQPAFGELDVPMVMQSADGALSNA